MNINLVPDLWRGREPRSFQGLVDRFFGKNWLDQFEPFESQEAANGFYNLTLDLAETDTEIRISAELPGMDEKDVTLTLAKDRLVIKGEKKEEKEEKKRDYYRRERHFGTFRRELFLPCDVDENKATAVFKKGILTITLPKSSQAQLEEKKIAIKAAA